MHLLFPDLIPCPRGWYYSNLRCYKLFLYKGKHYYNRSWSVAESVCASKDAYLVTYNSALEAYAVQKYLEVRGRNLLLFHTRHLYDAFFVVTVSEYTQ